MNRRILVVEGNVRETCERHRRAYGATPAQSYAAVIGAFVPGVACDIVCPADPDAELPGADALSGYAAIVVGGSALHAYDPVPEVTRQIAFMRRVLASGRPGFGSCWGMQIAAVAAGGVVARNPKGREIGFARAITATDHGRSHPLLTGRPAAFDAPTVHLDAVVEVPAGALVLATNARTDVQALEIRGSASPFWGVQYHPEYSLGEMAAILRRYRDPMLTEGLFRTEEDHSRYVSDLVDLDRDPSRTDLAWRLGLDEQVLDSARRLTEIANVLRFAGLL